MLSRYLKDESGATAIEYALIAGLIAVGMILGATALGDQLGDEFDTIAGEVANASSEDNRNQAVNAIQ
jgi:pilus assembly protein Flp/PilA